MDRYVVTDLDPSARLALKKVAERAPELTTRGHDKLLKVSRTVADLHRSPRIYKKHIAEAADLTGHYKVGVFLGAQPDVGICPSCGAELPEEATFCSSCGSRIEQYPA